MRVLRSLLLCVATLAGASQAGAASGDGLLASLSSAAPVLRGNVDVTVTLTLSNPTQAPISILRWDLPSGQHEAARFRILRDGQPVTYTGKLVKRAAPQPADYLTIAPGETVSVPVELTANYDLSRNGSYSIEYGSSGSLRSAPLYLWLEARVPLPTTKEAAPARSALQPLAGPIVFTGNCSATRQTQLTRAVAAATTYADGAVNYFNSTRAATARYVKWFGVANAANWATAKAHFVSIQDAFRNAPLTLDCSCTSSAYAYVFPSQPYKIYACNAFWSAPMTGTDSKAGTLIHEMSHFTVVAGTDDWAYGQAAAAALAISNPLNALNNADNHEYFAENTPSQY